MKINDTKCYLLFFLDLLRFSKLQLASGNGFILITERVKFHLKNKHNLLSLQILKIANRKKMVLKKFSKNGFYF